MNEMKSEGMEQVVLEFGDWDRLGRCGAEEQAGGGGIGVGGRVAARRRRRGSGNWYQGMQVRFGRGAYRVMDRIRRRYRQRFGRRADWKGYVAEIVGVSEYTVAAWRVGTQRPMAERMALLRQICKDLGRRQTGKRQN